MAHKHHWRPFYKSGGDVREAIMTPGNPESDKSYIILQDCDCGAVRTIEVEWGKAPEIRVSNGTGLDP